MTTKHYGAYTDKCNPVDARNQDFLFTSDGQAVKVVEKRSKPDPKAGRKPLPMKALRRLIKNLLNWKSYQERIAADNRDIIPLQGNPAVEPLFPVGTTGSPEKAHKVKDDPNWVSKAARNIDLTELEAWLYSDGEEPKLEPETRPTMPAVERTNERPTFIDVLKARAGGPDKVYDRYAGLDPNEPYPDELPPDFAEFLKREHGERWAGVWRMLEE